MSDESSRQQHPVADLLAGFAESSLTQHERESVLSHLAVCARCRQLVFLAHQVEPTPDTQSYNLKPLPFWRRKWIPLIASVSAVVALAVITFSWYGQFHKQPTPPGDEVAQQRTAPMPTGNENASKAAEVAPAPPPSATAMQKNKFAAKRVGTEHEAKKTVTSPSPAVALDTVEASGEEARRHTEEAQQAAVRRDRMEPGLNSASPKPQSADVAQKAQSANVMQSSAGSNAGTEDKAGYASRAIQPGKVGSQARAAWDGPPASAAVPASPAHRQEGTALAPRANPASESKQVHAEGCVEQGVEAGCLMVKDRKSGKLYHVLIKGLRPQPGDGIEFTGVPHDGPTSCMQGIPLDVISWVDKSSLKCAQTAVP